MSAGDVRSLIDRAQTLWNSHDRQGYVGLYTDDQLTTSVGDMRFEGRQGMEQFYDGWQGAFPDTRIDISLVICDESNASVEGIFNGTHTGVMMSPQGEVPPTGRTVAIPFVHQFALRGERFAIGRVYFDSAVLLAQLGLVESPARA
jgi:predicted ester cyclase